MTISLELHDRYRIERGARHLYLLGERAIAEFLIEGAGSGVDDLVRLIDRLGKYERCPSKLLRALGANRFPPRLSVVPR